MGHEGDERLDQVKVWLLEGDVDLSMNERTRFLLRGFGDRRMAVTEIRDADTTGKVEVLSTAHHRDIAAGAALDELIC